MPISYRPRARMLALMPPLLALSACATVGAMMSPYSEKFSCKNSDHGQCIHPEQAYEDAVAGRASKSDPAVTNDKTLLKAHAGDASARPIGHDHQAASIPGNAFAGYRDSVYRELQGLIDQPVTPMLRPPRAVRTLILPYSDRQRPDRLYMPRYVYSIVAPPEWVVGDYLVTPVSPANHAPVLGQVQDADDASTAVTEHRP